MLSNSVTRWAVVIPGRGFKCRMNDDAVPIVCSTESEAINAALWAHQDSFPVRVKVTYEELEPTKGQPSRMAGGFESEGISNPQCRQGSDREKRC